ncbi:MAG: glutathione peroxidase [Planctomycetaceae bacterium]|nr:glutathione peroxidase [Planctomycetaceae bacterium]
MNIGKTKAILAGVGMIAALATIYLTNVCRGEVAATRPASALAYTVKDMEGKDVVLADKYAGKVVLIVNVASKCGFTRQYKGLQELHDQYAAKGLAIAGFPCNQFGGQEPGDNKTIREFCESTYKVKFDLFDKIDVNGDQASPLYKYLTGETVPVADKGPVKWNFEKFLIGKDGQVIARYRSRVKPAQIAKDIEAALAK